MHVLFASLSVLDINQQPYPRASSFTISSQESIDLIRLAALETSANYSSVTKSSIGFGSKNLSEYLFFASSRKSIAASFFVYLWARRYFIF